VSEDESAVGFLSPAASNRWIFSTVSRPISISSVPPPPPIHRHYLPQISSPMEFLSCRSELDSNEYVVIGNARGKAIRQNATLAKSLFRPNKGAGLDLILMSSKKKSELRVVIRQAYVRDNSEDGSGFKRALRQSM
jgi:hypothetical protein